MTKNPRFPLSRILARTLAVAGVLMASVPAQAAGSTPLPDPNSVTLLSLGLAGLIIGRRVAAGRHKDD